MTSLRMMFRHRVMASESYLDNHCELLSGARHLDPPWNLVGRDKVPDMGSGICTTVRLARHLGTLRDSYILYTYRTEKVYDPNPDHSFHDDFMAIELTSKKINYDYVAREVFPCYATAFQSYYSTIRDTDLEISDNPQLDDPERVPRQWRLKYSNNTRELIIRINAVNYFDRELCRRSFGLTPEVMMERLSGKVEDARMLGDGLLLVYTYKFLEVEELKKVDGEVRKMLGIKSVLDG